MIGSLRGTLLHREPDGEVLIEVVGVGYRVTLTADAMARLGDTGTEVFVHIHHHIREDAQVLYGFTSRAERVCFEALLGAHGVGPALALAILGVHSPASLASAVADNDLDALCLVPGVGKKTAARLLVELGQRLDGVAALASPTGDAPSAGSSARAEVRAALAELGYGPDEIRNVLADVADEAPEAMLRQALQRLAVVR